MSVKLECELFRIEKSSLKSQLFNGFSLAGID